MQKQLIKGKIFLFKGPISFKLLKGTIEAVGSIITTASGIQHIPLGKSIPVEALINSEIKITSKNINNIHEMKSRTIPKTWDNLIHKIIKNKLKKLIVLGEMDTGKSFFITYMANKLIQLKKRVGIIDSDLGQSDIGPPGTIGYTKLEKPIMFLNNAKLADLEFVGSHSPGMHMLTTIINFNRIIKKSIQDCDITLVNTSGWILGDGGRLVSKAKMSLLNPDIIVLMQREDECEHLVKTIYPSSKIVKLHVSKKASETSKSDREQLRNFSSQNYFNNSKLISLSFDQIETENCFFNTGKQIKNINKYIDQPIIFAEKYPIYEGCLIVSEKKLSNNSLNVLKKNGYFNIRNLSPDFANGALISLRNKNYKVVDLGIISNMNFNKKQINIVTPFKGDKNQIKIIQFGALKYKNDGTENGFFEPGNF